MQESFGLAIDANSWLIFLTGKLLAVTHAQHESSLATAGVAYYDYFKLFIEGLLGLEDIGERVVVSPGSVSRRVKWFFLC